MKIITTVLLAIVFLVVACKTPKATPQKPISTIPVDFNDSVAMTLMEPFPSQTQISIGIVKNGKHVHLGFSKVDSLINPIENNEVLFQIGSITKVFTGILLGDAVHAGKVKLTDSLSSLLPYNFKNGGSVNLQHLTTHTSGIPSYPLTFQFNENYVENDPYNHVNEELVRDFLENHFLPQVKPGEQYAYSNLGVGLLGHILAGKNSMSLNETYQEKILKPFGMEDTCLNPENCRSEIATGLTNEGNETPCWTLRGISAAAGALLSNTNDMCKFITAVVSNEHPGVVESQKPLFRMRENTEVCMNWFYPDLEDYGHWYTHGGGTGGFSSSLFIDDETDNGIIVLSNVSAYHPKSSNIEAIAMEILREVNSK